MSKSYATTCNNNVLHHISAFLTRGWKWRKSPLGPLQTVLTLIQMSAFGIRGNAAAMQKLFDEVGGEYLGWLKPPSDSAFSRARRKCTRETIGNLLDSLRPECTHIRSHPQMRVAGFERVIAVDGTKLALSSQGTNKADFGCPNGEHLAPQALLTVLWDVGGNVPVDWRVGRFDESENAHLDSLLGSLDEGDIMLADRLYPSSALMERMVLAGRDFVFRVKTKSGALRTIKDFAASDERERVIEIRGNSTVSVRLVRGHRQGTEDIVFATSVLDADTLSAEAVADLYQRRWAVETAYREGKDWLSLRHLPGRNREQVEQEIAAVMLYWLMQGELEGQVRKKYAKEIAAQKPAVAAGQPATASEISELPVRFNRNLAAVVIGDVLRHAMADSGRAVEIWRVGMDNIWRHRSRRRPGRSNRRTSQRPHDLKKRDDIARANAKGGRAKGC
jgi:hypothetical protein